MPSRAVPDRNASSHGGPGRSAPRGAVPFGTGSALDPARPWLVASVAAAQVLLLIVYFSVTDTDVSMAKLLGSFTWEPASGPFSLRLFLPALAGHVLSAAVYLAWLAAAWCAGEGLLERLGPPPLDRLERPVAAVLLGLGAVAWLFFLLGIFGLLNRPAALAALPALALAGALASGRKRLPEPGRDLETLGKDARGPAGLALLIACAMLACHFLGALLPPVQFDELNYQLSLPKLWILNGGFVSTPYNHLSYHPRNMSMLFTAGLLTAGPAAAKLFSWGTGVLAGAALYAFGRRLVGGPAALLAAAFFTLIPVVGNQLRLAAADVGAAAYELVGAFLLLRWLEDRRTRTIAWSSLFWGLGIGCKYGALPGFAAGGLLALGASLSRERDARGLLRTAAAYGIPALAAAAPWLILNWWDSGNPVNPLFSTFFKSRNFYFDGTYAPMVDYSVGQGIQDYFPIHNPLDLIALPWNLLVRHNNYNHDMGPAWLAALPLLALAWKKPGRRLGALLLLCALYWIGFAMIKIHMARYYVAALALTSLAAAWGADRAFARAPGRRGAWVLAAPLLAAFLQQGGRMAWIQNTYKKPWGWLAGRTTLGDYLHDVLADSPHAACDFANRRLPPDARVLVFNEFRTFYLDRRFIASTPWDHDWWRLIVHSSPDKAEALRRLRALGVTHILVNDNYVLHHTGVERLKPWTPEETAKSGRLLKACFKPLHRSGGVWVGALRGSA